MADHQEMTISCQSWPLGNLTKRTLRFCIAGQTASLGRRGIIHVTLDKLFRDTRLSLDLARQTC